MLKASIQLTRFVIWRFFTRRGADSAKRPSKNNCGSWSSGRALLSGRRSARFRYFPATIIATTLYGIGEYPEPTMNGCSRMGWNALDLVRKVATEKIGAVNENAVVGKHWTACVPEPSCLNVPRKPGAETKVVGGNIPCGSIMLWFELREAISNGRDDDSEGADKKDGWPDISKRFSASPSPDVYGFPLARLCCWTAASNNAGMAVWTLAWTAATSDCTRPGEFLAIEATALAVGCVADELNRDDDRSYISRVDRRHGRFIANQRIVCYGLTIPCRSRHCWPNRFRPHHDVNCLQWIEKQYAKLSTATTRRKWAHWLIGLRRIPSKRYTSQLSSHVSSHRLSHSKCDAPSQLSTPESQPRHGGSNFQAARQLWRTVTCDALSQLISLVLLTACLDLLGFGIRSRKAISIPKRKVLLLLPLRCLPYRAVDRGAFAISFIPSRQARNSSLLTLSKLHLRSLKI